MALVLQDNYSNLAITLYGVRSQLLENTVIGVIQRVFIPTGCLILLTFLLKINCLRWILWILPWLNWLAVGCTHCTGVTKSSVSVYTGVSTTLKISQSKFNPSEQAAKEAVAKNHSLCSWKQAKEDVFILSPTRSQLFRCRLQAFSSLHVALALQAGEFRNWWIRTSFLRGCLEDSLYAPINIPVGSIAPSMTSLINYSCFGFSFSWSLALVPCAQLLNKLPSHKSLNQALLLNGEV